MPVPPLKHDVTYSTPAPNDVVSFSVICQPATSSCGADEFCAKVAESAIDDVLPDRAVLASVAQRLTDLGFEVFKESSNPDQAPDADQSPNPVVIASGDVARFQKVFRCHLTRMTRHTRSGGSTREVSAIVVAKGETPDPHAIKNALLVAVAEPPLFTAMPGTIGDTGQLCLALPHGVAVATHAAECHAMATGNGVVVAVVDSGFYDHRYFKAHPYQIARVTSLRAGNPFDDPLHHGTHVLANLLACAPGVNVHAVKFVDVSAGFAVAVAVPGIRIISLSWSYDVGANPMQPWLRALQLQIRHAVQKRGVTVVVAAGNWSGETFPALMREVIAVGGVGMDASGSVTAWPGTTPFVSSAMRQVPDLCGVASEIDLPMPPVGGSPERMQCMDGGTSCATAQVAGIAALLLEKNSSLTPSDVKAHLVTGAEVAAAGTGLASYQKGPVYRAGSAQGIATGTALVHALDSWHMVP